MMEKSAGMVSRSVDMIRNARGTIGDEMAVSTENGEHNEYSEDEIYSLDAISDDVHVGGSEGSLREAIEASGFVVMLGVA